MQVAMHDAQILRELAARIAEAASLPEQDKRRRLWYAQNRLQPERPLVYCSPEGAWEEIMPSSIMTCEHPLMREWERALRMRLYAWEHFHDDQVLDYSFRVHHVYKDSGWGMEPRKVYSDTNRGAYYWYGPLREEGELAKLHPPRTEVDWPATEQQLELAHQVFDGLLHVELKTSFWWSISLIGEFAMLRGLEQIMVDMCERPRWVHEVMRFLMNGRLQWLDSLEQQSLLALNNGNDYVGSGGFGFSDELPAPAFDDSHVRTRDMWGFAEAQEITGISPAMHDEFVMQYQIPLLERFGLNCYGCCEPLHHKFHVIMQAPRLRRISISPWCDREIAAEALEDKYIFSWKPHPGYLADITFDPEAVRANIRETLDIARGCVVEMIIKDTHTCNNQPERFDQWTQVAMGEAERAAP